MNVIFQYGLKPPYATIRASKRRGTESYRAWICSWEVSLHIVCIRVQKESRVIDGGQSGTSSLPTIPHTCSMDHMPGERVGQGSSNTSRFSKKACIIFNTWMDIDLLNYGLWSFLTEQQYLRNLTASVQIV